MYSLTALYLYKVVFSLELVVAETLVCSDLRRKRRFFLRLALSAVIMAGAAFAIPLPDWAYNAFYCSGIFLALFMLSLVTLKLCYDEKLMPLVFCGIAAYTIQHTAYQLFNFAMIPVSGFFQSFSMGNVYGSGEVGSFPIVVYAAIAGEQVVRDPTIYMFLNLVTYAVYAFVYFVTYAAGYIFVHPRMKNIDKLHMSNLSAFAFAAAMSVFNIFVSAAVMYFGDVSDIFTSVLLGCYNICCCFFVLFIMFEVMLRKAAQHDYYVVNYLWEKNKEQGDLMKENIDVINMKCHDLKHQIRRIGQKSALDEKLISEIENVISVYDSGIKTGNETLDTILTEKSLYCLSRGIRLNCIADGTLLSGLEASDMYSLFGNLLDNAISAVENLPDRSKVIKLSVHELNGFPVIKIANAYEGELVFEGGLPRTTKENKAYHGFGMKSVKSICEKYNAELRISADGGIFRLSIVFLH